MSEHHTRPTAVTPDPVGALETGTLLAGRYRLVAPLATGGMATVWRAVDQVLTRPVAVKILHARLAADPEFVARFRREAVAAARLAHPSIVAIYDTSSDPEAIIMELVEGRTLRAELDGRGFLPPEEAVEIASSIAAALEIAHKAGIVHRDVKPANVLLSEDGRLKVADFGIAKAARSGGSDDDPDLPDLTAIGHMVGTAKYLAPEQVSGGHVDARTDVYALGAVLYEMLCGRAPFTGDNDLAIAVARLHVIPERPRSVLRTIPHRLDDVVMQALATDPDDRFASASSLWAALQAAPVATELRGAVGNDEERVDATTVTATPSFARAERSWLVPALLVSVVAVALGLAWILIGGTEARRDLFDLVDRVSPGGGSGTAQAQPIDDLIATAYDPIGGDGENDGEAALAVDDDAATAWSTEGYDSRAFGGLKDGVGIYVDLGRQVDLDELVVESPSSGWAARIYVADQPGAEIGDWGDPVEEVTDVVDTTTIDLDGASGTFVLVWLTDPGDAGDDGRHRFQLQELSVTTS
ncbi:MAG: protein kinase domain-containing protein [Acidimicrobiales bacterium]